MAQRIVTAQRDDTDGTAAAETVRFGLDGAFYEIDLSAGHAAELRAALTPYVAAGRRESRLLRPMVRTAVATDADPSAVRAWARNRGIDLPARGRIPASIVERFHAAGN